MNSLFTLWENVDTDTFYIENNSKKIFKKEIDESIHKFQANIISVSDISDTVVYLDIKDRLLFFIITIAFSKLKAKIVLVPYEIKIENYYFKGGFFLSDNKIHPGSVFINSNLSVNIGENFNSEIIDKTKTDPDILLYLYTSGSTGKAKLIPKTISNLLSEAKELSKIFETTGDDIFYFTPPLCHIYGFLFGFLLPLFSSSKIILTSHFTPESIANFVLNNKIDFFISIPSYYRMFSELKLIESFKNIKVLTSSSAPLAFDLSKNFYDKEISITEVYGSTETGGIARRISPKNTQWQLFSYVKIINEWDDYLSEIKDQNNNIVELKVVSPAVSVSYDKTAGYNTGDVVSFDSKDTFTLLGRNTRFVKISGKRVDLGFVAEKFKEYLLANNISFIKEEEIYIGEKDGKIYILYENKFPKKSKEMKEDLKKILPGYAVPRFFIETKIPRNSMGKINKVKIEALIYEKNKDDFK